jgi:hypothetical protein
MRYEIDKNNKKSGAIIVFSVFALFAFLLVGAMAFEAGLLKTSSDQQDNNAEYAAESALRMFISFRNNPGATSDTSYIYNTSLSLGVNRAVIAATRNFYASAKGVSQADAIKSIETAVCNVTDSFKGILTCRQVGVENVGVINAIRVTMKASQEQGMKRFFKFFGNSNISLGTSSAIAVRDNCRKKDKDEKGIAPALFFIADNAKTIWSTSGAIPPTPCAN